MCDDAAQIIAKLAKFYPIEWEIYDITRDPKDYEKYGLEIPVVEIDGERVAEGCVTQYELVGYFERCLRNDR